MPFFLLHRNFHLPVIIKNGPRQGFSDSLGQLYISLLCNDNSKPWTSRPHIYPSNLQALQELKGSSLGDCILIDSGSLCNCRTTGYITDSGNLGCLPHTHNLMVISDGSAKFAVGFKKGNTIDSRMTPDCVADLHWPSDWYSVSWDWKSRCLLDSKGNSTYQIRTPKRIHRVLLTFL